MSATSLERASLIQQAETSGANDQFLQIGAGTTSKKRPPHKLARVAFRVSRLMEFCNLRELENQTGHQVWDWPLVALKELFDNSLDACEEAEIAPVIAVAVRPGEIVVQDNGTGITDETVRSIRDYSIRVSSREAYISPSRGAQGNALKTLLAMGYVLDRRWQPDNRDNLDAAGVTIIETRGAAHKIEFLVDHVTNEPRITHTRTRSPITIGTRIAIQWPQHCKPLLDRAEDEFKKLAENYTWLNPHLSLRGTWNDHEFVSVQASNPGWIKWGPRDPTSPHWYNDARLQRYLSAHVARDRELGKDRPVREFIAEFRGLSSSRKQKEILAELGVSHRSLREFFGKDKVNRDGISRLLAAMKRHSAPVPPKHLGVIGREHLQTRFLAAGGAEKTFRYERRTGVSEENNPYIVEFACGLHRSGLDGSPGARRKIVSGANWSVGIHNPFRRFGHTGEGLETTLARVRANASQPVICCLHLASAHLRYADRGKSSIITTGTAEATDV
jgi:DNA topoisomerase VI subunit B